MGVDPDFVSLTENRSLRCRIVGSGAHLPFPDGCFDLASANMVLEHIPEPEVVFREVARVLVPGGWSAETTRSCRLPPAAGSGGPTSMTVGTMSPLSSSSLSNLSVPWRCQRNEARGEVLRRTTTR